METLKFNRVLAITVMILVIAAAIPCGVIRSVNALERKVEKIYDAGNERNGTVRTDLTRLADYGQNLYALAEPLGCADAAFAEAVTVLRGTIGSPITDGGATTALMSAASLAYNRIMALPEITESQKNSAVLYFYEMDSTRARLQNNEQYAAAARKYNRAIESFPASLLCGGKEPAITFK
ncbi:MAG: hypothetical protein E7662_12925 [Ruminococcaceae bacterium]|nr:hypothetical protein [Oscillospiraceae bacterium]